MAKSTNPAHVVTGKVRFGFNSLFRPSLRKDASPNEEPKYCATIMIPFSDTATKARIDRAIDAAFKRGEETGALKGVPRDKVQTPVYDGNGYRHDGYTPFGPECKNCWVLTASCKPDRNKPQVVDAMNNPIIDQSEVYAGMYGQLSFDFFPYSTGSNRGIGASLVNAKKLEDGEPIGPARPSADDDFGSADDFDPLS